MKVKETMPCGYCGGIMEKCGNGWYCRNSECGFNFASAPKSERIVKECLSCGEKYHPLDDNDMICKSCLKKLFIELIVKMQSDIKEIRSSVPYKLNNMDELLRRYHKLADKRYGVNSIENLVDKTRHEIEDRRYK